MNLKPGAELRSDAASRASTPIPDVIGSDYDETDAAGTRSQASQWRPVCLLAAEIHEVGRTSGAARLAWAIGNDQLARRLEREYEGWSHLYEFTCQRICPALREEAIEPEATSLFADAALAAMPATVPADILMYLRRRLTTCATYRTADDCPFLNPSRSKEDQDQGESG